MRDVTIWSWNVEDLARHLAATAAAAERRLFTETPAIICFQEVRVRPNDAASVAAMCSAFPGYDCHYSLARDPYNATYRGGRAYGVATWIAPSLKARAVTPAWDREGRVVFSVLGRQRLVIANIYAVNGTPRPYFDPILGRPAGDRHAWKRRFNALLAAECEQWRARGHRLILIGDWNISRAAIDVHPRLRSAGPHALARAQLNDTIMPALDLVDIFRVLHPDQRAYTWYSRTARTLDAARVDYALVSRELVGAVRAAEIGPRPERGAVSDHASLWITLGATASSKRRARSRRGRSP